MIKAHTINWDALLPYVGAVVLILIGAAQFPQLLSLNYILQQFQIASFLGVIAVGAMIVILLGHIDLSVPWVLGGSAILSTALVGTGDPILTAIAIPAGAVIWSNCWRHKRRWRCHISYSIYGVDRLPSIPCYWGLLY